MRDSVASRTATARRWNAEGAAKAARRSGSRPVDAKADHNGGRGHARLGTG
jgi:hypothetical protein